MSKLAVIVLFQSQITINFFPLSCILPYMKFVILQNFGVLGTIQLKDCCVISDFGRRNTGVAAL